MSNPSKPGRSHSAIRLLALLLIFGSCDRMPEHQETSTSKTLETKTTTARTEPVETGANQATPRPAQTVASSQTPAKPPLKSAAKPTAGKPAQTAPDAAANSASVQQRIEFNLSKLKDPNYTDTYGHGYTLYKAAEELGKIGKPAVPGLIAKLDSQDPYELMVSLYALQLATQDPGVKALTNGEYVNLDEALDEASNAENRQVALQWWERHKAAF